MRADIGFGMAFWSLESSFSLLIFPCRKDRSVLDFVVKFGVFSFSFDESVVLIEFDACVFCDDVEFSESDACTF